MSRADRKRGDAGIAAYCTTAVALVLVTIAFLTPYWIQYDYRIYGANLEKLGLWTHCFRSLPDPKDYYHFRYFVGCRWILDPFTTGYREIRSYINPPFMVATQVLFTFCFFLLLCACVLVFLVILHCLVKREVRLMRIISLVLLISGIFGTFAVIVFGAKAASEEWLPNLNPAHTYLSWSYGLAVVGVFFEFVTALLFYLESRLQRKRDLTPSSQASYVAASTKA